MVQGKYLILLFNGRLFYFTLHYNLSSSFSAILFYVTVALLSLQIKQIKRGISSNSYSTNILLLHHKKQRNDYFIFKWKRISSRPPIMYIAEVGFFVRSVQILIFKCTIGICTRVKECSNARQLRTQSVDDDLFFGSIKKGFHFRSVPYTLYILEANMRQLR